MDMAKHKEPTILMKVEDLVWKVCKSLGARVSPKLTSVLDYKRHCGKFPDLKNPRNFNEKLLWLRLYVYKDLKWVTRCVDKYLVREYVKEKGCEETLNELYGAWDSVDEIEWEKLPDQFVIKCNHGCGYNIVCRNKEELDIDAAKAKLKKWMKEDIWLVHVELNYRGIKRKIICEKYIASIDSELPLDYKIYYFNGIPKLVLVCSDRDEKLNLSFYDLEWNKMDIGRDNNAKDIPKPYSLAEMLEYGKRLAEGYPFVRVDFYECDNKPIFGEMTFSPAACTANYYNERGLQMLGEYLKLPK